MDWFELNSHLRLLRQQQQQHSIPQRSSFLNNPSSQLPTTTTSTSKIPTNIGNSQFVITGRRLETLKSLRKLLKKFPNRLNRSTIITIFDCLKSIIVDLTAIYFNLDSGGVHQPNLRNNHPNGSFIPHPMVRCNSMAQIPSSTTMTMTTTASKTQSPSMLRKTLSTDNVFIQSIRRNELLESIQIIIDLISMKSIPLANQSDNQSINNQQMAVSNSSDQDVDGGCQEDYFGRMFLPEIITLLGKIRMFCLFRATFNLSIFIFESINQDTNHRMYSEFQYVFYNQTFYVRKIFNVQCKHLLIMVYNRR